MGDWEILNDAKTKRLEGTKWAIRDGETKTLCEIDWERP